MLLLGADSINVAEGMARDISSARVPNIPAEMGVRAAWRYNKGSLILKVSLLSG